LLNPHSMYLSILNTFRVIWCLSVKIAIFTTFFLFPSWGRLVIIMLNVILMKKWIGNGRTQSDRALMYTRRVTRCVSDSYVYWWEKLSCNEKFRVVRSNCMLHRAMSTLSTHYCVIWWSVHWSRQLVHWPLMGGLLNLKRGRAGRARETVLRSWNKKYVHWWLWWRHARRRVSVD